MNENKDKYGPELIIDRKIDFFLRKFKREIIYCKYIILFSLYVIFNTFVFL